jgi:hypothetical protein
MSRAVWQHKCDGSVRTQSWNLMHLPDDFLPSGGTVRLYVAMQGHWRGYFQVHAFQWTPEDHAGPFALFFAPGSWMPIDACPAPRRLPTGYTLDVPATSVCPTNHGPTK